MRAQVNDIPHTHWAYYLFLISAAYPLHFLIQNIGYFPPTSFVYGFAANAVLFTAAFFFFFLFTRTAASAFTLLLLFWFIYWSFSFITQETLTIVKTSAIIQSFPVWILENLPVVFNGLACTALGWLAYVIGDKWVRTPKGQKLFSAFLHILILVPLLSYASQAVSSHLAIRSQGGSSQQAASSLPKPDIYYIILDAYGRDDILKSLYHYDNSPFTNSLKKKGFYVASKSNSNYVQTALSLSSSLNMNYLPQLLRTNALQYSADRNLLGRVIKNSRVKADLKKRGYKIVAIDSGYFPSQLGNADIYIHKEAASIFHQRNMEFLFAMFETQTNGLLSYSDGNYIVFRFQALLDTIAIDGPKFVFAHFLSPHPPFLFMADSPLDSYTRPGIEQNIGADGNHYTHFDPKLVAQYVKYYPQQVQYINRQVMRFIDQVLKEKPNSIIIIQGDHGPGAHLDWGSVEKSNIPERLSIVNTYYFPGQDYSRLYKDITPINSFRVVFNQFFGEDYPMLPDESFFSIWDEPFNFVPVKP